MTLHHHVKWRKTISCYVRIDLGVISI